MRALSSVFAVLLAAAPAFAQPVITIEDPYARSSGATAISGAAFMVISNTGTTDDRVIAASSDVAKRIELHTHIQDANGVMRMIEVEDGIAVPAGGQAMLKRGGDHVMMMGLNRPLEQGDTVMLTLTFEVSGERTIEIPVDLMRGPGHGGQGS